jgi:transposase
MRWYQAVLAVVQDGWKVSEVAERLGVSRQNVHAWIARYEQVVWQRWPTVDEVIALAQGAITD